MPMLRWLGGLCVMSSPSMVMVPAVGSSKPAIMRRVVVLPQPLGPRKETNSPGSTDRLKSSTAVVAPKVLAMWERDKKDIVKTRAPDICALDAQPT